MNKTEEEKREEVMARIRAAITEEYKRQTIVKRDKKTGEVTDQQRLPLFFRNICLASYPEMRFYANANTEGLARKGVWLEIVDGRWAHVSPELVEMRVRHIAEIARDKHPTDAHINKVVKDVIPSWSAKAIKGTTAIIDQGDCILDATGLPLSLSAGLAPVAPDPDMPLMRRLATAYEPDAECPRWEKSVHEWMRGHQEQSEVEGWFQRTMGHGLLRGNPERMFQFWVGGGTNGKTCAAETLLRVLGLDFALPMDCDPFLRGFAGDKLRSLSALEHKLIAIIEEIPEEANWATGLLKKITGGSHVEVREIYESPRTIRMFALLIALSNSRPTFGDGSKGWVARLRVLEWLQNFEGSQNKNLADEHVEEASGILNWLGAGLAAYNAGGERPPLAVRTATKDYIEDHGPQIRRFIGEMTRPHATQRIKLSELRSKFINWLVNTGEYDSVRAAQERNKANVMRKMMLGFLAASVKKEAGPNGLQWYLTGHKFIDPADCEDAEERARIAKARELMEAPVTIDQFAPEPQPFNEKSDGPIPWD